MSNEVREKICDVLKIIVHNDEQFLYCDEIEKLADRILALILEELPYPATSRKLGNLSAKEKFVWLTGVQECLALITKKLKGGEAQ